VITALSRFRVAAHVAFARLCAIVILETHLFNPSILPLRSCFVLQGHAR
jgi:hypothetical protein